jgi:hypothetical protein
LPEPLLKAEEELAADASAKGEREALESWSGREIRLYRDGKLPVSARTSIGDLLIGTPGTISMKAEYANVAASGEFGYAYGSTVLRLPDSPALKTLQFVRVWKKQDNGRWRVAVDILN